MSGAADKKAAAHRLPVVLLWHMHQPQYRDALTGEFVLPWTYLHAIKDYADMAAHLEDVEGARAVVNFTPVLIEQLEQYATMIEQHLRAGAPLRDPLLRALTEQSLPVDPAQRAALLRACLRAQRERMIDRFAPFAELAKIVELLATPERAGYAADALVRDAVVWYHLAWTGETLRRHDLRLAALVNHRGSFSQAQRRQLLEIIGEVMGSILPRYRRLAERGVIELSVTPYAHPILPLLQDFQTATESVPNTTLPWHAAYPGGADRAVWQVAESLKVFQRHFGFRPTGCWPAEGAVSEATIGVLERFGFRWAASSAKVLRTSLERSGSDDPEAGLNRPWRLEGQRLEMYFRSDGLSDLIGFQYATWHGDDAAQHFATEVAKVADHLADDPGCVLLIALDGENAWEHYPYNGYWFLRALYQALARHPKLHLTTLSEAQASLPEARVLPKLAAGSWVHGSLATWIGDPAKNAAWDLLCEAKHAYDRIVVEGALNADQVTAAERQLALCESSDWFWWFGDYNPADAVEQFDRLYRRQLLNLYRLLGLPSPESLQVPLSVGGGAPEQGGVMRRASG